MPASHRPEARDMHLPAAARGDQEDGIAGAEGAGEARPSDADGAAGAAGLSHVDETGAARMVDVSQKDDSQRVAEATGAIRMAPQTLALIAANGLKKGDVLAVARVAGTMAAKRTADLIPLCHQLPLTGVEIVLTL